MTSDEKALKNLKSLIIFDSHCKPTTEYKTEQLEKFILKTRQEVREERDEQWRAYLHKSAWKKEEIDDANGWVDRTPLRLDKKHSLRRELKKEINL